MFSKRLHLLPPSLIAVIPLLVAHRGVVQYGIHASRFQGLTLWLKGRPNHALFCLWLLCLRMRAQLMMGIHGVQFCGVD